MRVFGHKIVYLRKISRKKSKTMPRAKRYYVPGLTWHITHRCQEKEYLLNFSKDRKRWLHWLLRFSYQNGASKAEIALFFNINFIVFK